MQFDYSKVRDPKIFCENRIPVHSDHKYYATKAEALKEKSSLVSSLNGLWKFSYAKNYKSAIKGFETVDL